MYLWLADRWYPALVWSSFCPYLKNVFRNRLAIKKNNSCYKNQIRFKTQHNKTKTSFS